MRSSEDIAYSVARFFSKNGTLVNYYMVWFDPLDIFIKLPFTESNEKLYHFGFMEFLFHLCLQYHGGTNFGRTAASFVTPRYYDDAPLDEFG